jgi:uncharacterized protein
MRRRIFLTVVALGIGLAYLLFRTRERFIARLLRLPLPRYRVDIQRDLPIPMPDGVRLYADHLFPREAGDYPTVLIRTPYGRPGERSLGGLAFNWFYETLAAQGYHVVVQSVRGRFSSEGQFAPFVNEAADGRATMEWIAQQPWFDGNLGMWGASYLGYVQWSVAADAPPYLRALVPAITSSRFSRLFYNAEGLFSFESTLNWVYVMQATAGKRIDWATAQQISPARVIAAARAAHSHTDISMADLLVTGKKVEWYQNWLSSHRHDAPYWRSVDLHHALASVHAPIHLVAGWYDIFIRDQIVDYATLLAAGKTPYLTIGPQHHTDLSIQLDALRESFAWFAAHLKGELDQLRKRSVKVFLMGAEEWHEMDFWPPPAQMTRYYFNEHASLGTTIPATISAFDRYTFDPADPTPNIGGPLLLSVQAGRRDQAALERRGDLLVYTSAPLPQHLDVIGHVRLELFVRPSEAVSDLVGRLCVVEASGRSYNVCDGVVRLSLEAGALQSDGSLRVEIDLGPTAQRFKRGERLRVHIASAGHPRWRSYPVSGEDRRPLEQHIYRDAEHPSAIVLPVVTPAFLAAQAESMQRKETEDGVRTF